MEVQLTQEQESQLAQIAHRDGKTGAGQLLNLNSEVGCFSPIAQG